MRRSVAVVLMFGLFGLCACGSGSTTTASTGSSGSTGSAAEASSTPAASSAPAAGTSSAAGGAAASAKDLCAFLEQEAPTLETIGSDVGALARLTGDLFTWSEKSGFTLADDRQIDTLTQQGCPEVRARILKKIGAESFAAAF